MARVDPPAPADPAGLDFAAYVQGVAEWEPSEDDKRAVEHQADPAGLDAAIEAARWQSVAAGRGWVATHHWGYGRGFILDDRLAFAINDAAVRAAAPHLRAAALNEAADEWEARGRPSFAKWLRERAGRELQR
jgi:hypothetical protein